MPRVLVLLLLGSVLALAALAVYARAQPPPGHYGPRKYRRARAQVWENALPESLVERMKEEAKAVHAWEKGLKLLKNNKKQTRWFRAGARPKNALEEAIVRLLPLVRPGQPPHDFVGAEWWVQVVAPGQQGTIGFHLDKDESVASLKQYLIHAEWNSVFYLTNSGGCTLCLDQVSPNGNGYAPHVPHEGEVICPKRNKYMIFDGDLLHGVLPGREEHRDMSETERITFLINWWHVKPEAPNCQKLPRNGVPGVANLDRAQLRALRKDLDAELENTPRALKRRRVLPDFLDLIPQRTNKVETYPFTYELPGGATETVMIPKELKKGGSYSLRWKPGWPYRARKEVKQDQWKTKRKKEL